MIVGQISVQANLRNAQVKAQGAGRSQNLYDVIQDFIEEKREEYDELLEEQKDDE